MSPLSDYLHITLSLSLANEILSYAGQKEIVTDECGLKWDTTQELVSNTEYIFSHPQEAKLLSANSIKRSTIFSKENYTKEINSLINSLSKEEK